MIAIVKNRNRVLSGVLASDLHCVFYCLGARVQKHRLLFMIARSQLVELLTHCNVRLIRRNHEASMGKLRSSLSHGICNPLVRSANGGHSNTGGKVNVGVVISINQDTTIGSNDITRQTCGKCARDGSLTACIYSSAFLPHSIRHDSTFLWQVVIEGLHVSSCKI